MSGKRIGPMARFLISVVTIGVCHFGIFAVCYYYYRKSYYMAPTHLQCVLGTISEILGYPLWLVGLVPSEPGKVVVIAASMANSLLYAVVLSIVIRLFRAIVKRGLSRPRH